VTLAATVFETPILTLFTLAIAKLVEHILQLWGQFGEHLHDFLSLIVMGQTSQWLEEYRKTIQFVPEGQDHANLLDVVSRWVAFKKVGLAALLLLAIEFRVFAH